MKIRFWGVRGSVGSPGPKTQIFGGNTSCIEVIEKNHRIILDAGTGLRPLGLQLIKKNNFEEPLSIFISHYHIDHITGLPFFRPLHNPKQSLHLYGPVGAKKPLPQVLASLFSEEFFPVPFHEIPAKLSFKELKKDKVTVGPFTIESLPINHPGSTLGYVVSNGKKKFAYMPDHEPIEGHVHFKERGQGTFEKYRQELRSFLKGCDTLIHDAFFPDARYGQFRGWGHSPLSYPMELAKEAGIKRLIYFHYAPESTDKELKKQRDWALKKIKRQKSGLDLIFSREDLVVTL